jgi:short-subunit dehydrogenase
MVDLKGKPIAITGASSGIGRATALACARAGMPVAVMARREDKLRSLVREIEALGGRAVALVGSVDKPDDCERLIARTIEAFGSIHAVFANAGYGLERPIHEMSDADMRAIFETNFFGTLSTTRPAVRAMLAAGSGHVLICSSCLSKFGTAYHGAYSATKAAQNHIARAMNIELAARRIRVSSVHPVGTKTEFFETARINSGGATMLDNSPGAFMQSPDRVARAIVACLRRPRSEVWTSLPARLFFGLVTMFPALGDAVMRRWAARRGATPHSR